MTYELCASSVIETVLANAVDMGLTVYSVRLRRFDRELFYVCNNGDSVLTDNDYTRIYHDCNEGSIQFGPLRPDGAYLATWKENGRDCSTTLGSTPEEVEADAREFGITDWVLVKFPTR